MQIFKSMNVSSSGLTAERFRLDLIANNIANAHTTRSEDGGPYQRKSAVFAEVMDGARKSGQGVRVQGVSVDSTEPRLVYEPEHPDANEEGYVAYPNVNIVQEMVDMITATRAYEANVTALNASKNMFLKALEIGRG
ncbi:flagellar basal body rod protein FlgC [Dethiobacter alkaliphilus]|uniref:flagellar basal body rod protein FlgC n=1 Tax=Dethiobacter alkaliphilus TaxID=427926 RepID=UPI002227499F|nr:flagellar basal body rod protein FlgC [Dethiobacter alkaliphilus]MCW3488750.1 flagellar basal body rod protein FlgC [Dethiobacter alkaliphilus]